MCPAGDCKGMEAPGSVHSAAGCECSCSPPHLTPELTVADRRQKREIRQLEQELHKWQVLVDSITGEEARPLQPPPALLSTPQPSSAHLRPPALLSPPQLSSALLLLPPFLAPTPAAHRPAPVPCLPLRPFLTSSFPRHELSRLRQPDPGGAAGPHGAVPDALARGEAGPPHPRHPSLASLLCHHPLSGLDFSSFPVLCGPPSSMP